VPIKSPARQATPEASQPPTMLVDAKEAARQLSLSVRKVRYLTKEGRLKVRRIDGSIRYPLSDLVAFASRDQIRTRKA
jgi:hypothetical protein